MQPVILGAYAQLITTERLAATVGPDGRRMASAAQGPVRAAPDTIPGPIHRARRRTPGDKAYVSRAGELPVREVATGLRGRPSVGIETPVP